MQSSGEQQNPHHALDALPVAGRRQQLMGEVVIGDVRRVVDGAADDEQHGHHRQNVDGEAEQVQIGCR